MCRSQRTALTKHLGGSFPRRIPCEYNDGLHRLQARKPAGETVLGLESRACSSWSTLTIHMCLIRRFLSAGSSGPYQDGVPRSDATDRSTLQSGTCACTCASVVSACAHSELPRGGTTTVQAWYKGGTTRYKHGTRTVQAWYKHGTTRYKGGTTRYKGGTTRYKGGTTRYSM